MTPLPAGATIGILGGGQLGRMLALAAARLGFDVHVYAPEADSPAARVAARCVVAPYEDQAALTAFARSVDVLTYEFENVPVSAVQNAASAGALVRPGPRALEMSQDRLVEKDFLAASGFATTTYAPIESRTDLAPALQSVSTPAILKTRRFGYDGKGQAWIRSADDAQAAFDAIGGQPAILEQAVDFACEASVIAARGADGRFAAYDLVENQHQAGILRQSSVPCAASTETAALALSGVRELAQRLDYVGVLAVEFFLTRDDRLIANEIAPRVHNSGHWTEDACATGQFEQHIRAVAGWPLGDPRRLFASVEMRNLIGEDVLGVPAWTADPLARVRLYGKREVRPGRKMGHVTRIRDPLS